VGVKEEAIGLGGEITGKVLCLVKFYCFAWSCGR